MPLTAYSRSAGSELDVQQVLFHLATREGLPVPSGSDDIPENWRAEMREDLECPCCFVRGAEVVRESISRKVGTTVRQACFRFASPGHDRMCDFAGDGNANITPENLVPLGSAKSAITRAVRDLVCAGIQIELFDQRSIRDMREWYFRRKLASAFTVTLDPNVPAWFAALHQSRFYAESALPKDVALTSRIASIPGFRWKAEAHRAFALRYKALIDQSIQSRVFIHGPLAKRIAALARTFHGKTVFDPRALAEEYQATRMISSFICNNYAPISSQPKKDEVSASVLAFASLLLFVSNWDQSEAVAKLAEAANAVGTADTSLGNVMGLNPFHDFKAWDRLIKLQALEVPKLATYDATKELAEIEAALHASFGIG